MRVFVFIGDLYQFPVELRFAATPKVGEEIVFEKFVLGVVRVSWDTIPNGPDTYYPVVNTEILEDWREPGEDTPKPKRKRHRNNPIDFVAYMNKRNGGDAA